MDTQLDKLPNMGAKCDEICGDIDQALAANDIALSGLRQARKMEGYFNYEHQIGRAVMAGEITAEEASEALGGYEAWLNGTSTEAPA